MPPLLRRSGARRARSVWAGIGVALLAVVVATLSLVALTANRSESELVAQVRRHAPELAVLVSGNGAMPAMAVCALIVLIRVLTLAAATLAVGLLVLILLSVFAHIPREDQAGTMVESYLPRPEWYYMWLFQLLTYFPGKWEAVGSLVIPFALVALLFALPFLDRSRRMGARNRPLPLAGAIAMLWLAAAGYVVAPVAALAQDEVDAVEILRQADAALRDAPALHRAAP